MQLSTEQMFSHIVEMQCELNEKTVPNWLQKNLDWEIAILVEVAEAIDSTDWKWWKHTETDLVNLKIEAIDLLHFIVSKMINENVMYQDFETSRSWVISDLVDAYCNCSNLEAFKTGSIHRSIVPEILKAIAKNTLLNRDRLIARILMCLFKQLEMDAQSIYKAYITKNLLNHYRLERGYKDPNTCYLKIINGLEDNIVFAACVDNALKIKSEQPLTLEQIKVYAFTSMDAVVFDAINL